MLSNRGKYPNHDRFSIATGMAPNQADLAFIGSNRLHYCKSDEAMRKNLKAGSIKKMENILDCSH